MLWTVGLETMPDFVPIDIRQHDVKNDDIGLEHGRSLQAVDRD